MDGQRDRDLHGTAPGLCGKEGAGDPERASTDGAAEPGAIEKTQGGGGFLPR